MVSKTEKGKRGEDIAAKLLEQKGYTIVCRNKRYGYFETDIICENDDHLVFVEVKTRRYNPLYGRPAAAVNFKKKQNLITCAEMYIAEHGTNGKQVRLDVIEVYETENGIFTDHLQNAITK